VKEVSKVLGDYSLGYTMVHFTAQNGTFDQLASLCKTHDQRNVLLWQTYDFRTYMPGTTHYTGPSPLHVAAANGHFDQMADACLDLKQLDQMIRAACTVKDCTKTTAVRVALHSGHFDQVLSACETSEQIEMVKNSLPRRAIIARRKASLRLQQLNSPQGHATANSPQNMRIMTAEQALSFVNEMRDSRWLENAYNDCVDVTSRKNKKQAGMASAASTVVGVAAGTVGALASPDHAALAMGLGAGTAGSGSIAAWSLYLLKGRRALLEAENREKAVYDLIPTLVKTDSAELASAVLRLFECKNKGWEQRKVGQFATAVLEACGAKKVPKNTLEAIAEYVSPQNLDISPLLRAGNDAATSHLIAHAKAAHDSVSPLIQACSKASRSDLVAIGLQQTPVNKGGYAELSEFSQRLGHVRVDASIAPTPAEKLRLEELEAEMNATEAAPQRTFPSQVPSAPSTPPSSGRTKA
jgi:hypothetical protein